MWKWRKAVAVTAPTALLAVWMLPPAGAQLLGDLPSTPEPAAMVLVGVFLIGMASAIRRGTPGSPVKG
jgi:hypothetical protein